MPAPHPPVSPLPVSVAIPTFGREKVLLDTIQMLLEQDPPACEIRIIDQTAQHAEQTERQLGKWEKEGKIYWIRRQPPSQPAALNAALQQATCPFVLFLDDDIRIEPGFIRTHLEAFENDEIWAVAGQVLQPGEQEDPAYCNPETTGPFSDVHFCFRSGRKCSVQNGMSGNLAVRREKALQIGGFDENFTPPVAYRFDNDFCKRLCEAGGKIMFEPKARIYHLRAERGGTRSTRCHLTSMSPDHGVGDYYFALKRGFSHRTIRYILRRPFREVCTRFHLRHPWWIPVKLLGEIRAGLRAGRLYRHGPALIITDHHEAG